MFESFLFISSNPFSSEIRSIICMMENPIGERPSVLIFLVLGFDDLHELLLQGSYGVCALEREKDL